MNSAQMQIFYRHLINLWMKKDDVESFCPYFYSKIQEKTSVCISSDSRVINVFISWLENPELQVFSQKCLSQHKNRDKMFSILAYLYQTRFIDRQEYRQVQYYKNIYTINKIQIFLASVAHCDSDDEKNSLWKDIVGIPMEDFWDIMYKKQIKDQILYQLYQETKCLQNIRDNKFINNFVKQHLEEGNQQKESIKMTHALKKKVMKEQSLQNEGLSLRLKKQNTSIFQSTIQSYFNQLNLSKSKSDQNILSKEEILIYPQQIRLSKLYAAQSQKKQEQFHLIHNTWFSEYKFNKFQRHLQKISDSSNAIQNLVNQIAFQNSLFYNRKHSELLQNIYKAIIQITSRIQHASIESFQLFGSLRSTLALSNSLDIDITSIVAHNPRTNRSQRERYISLLFNLRHQIMGEKPQWLKSAFVMNFPKLPVPFLKLTIQEQIFESLFPLCKISKVDITIGNQTAVRNSNLIQHFTKNEKIALFCILVKLWAKNLTIINSSTPMNGLSSYGVVLMSLYFLMDTKQLDFIQYDENKPSEQLIYPNIDQCQVKSLQQNFTGFLQFYRETGIFQRERKTVCLLKDFNKRQLFNEEIIINMYDFIDKSNPGRLNMKHKHILFQKIKESLQIMKSQDANQISSLFK